MRVTRAIAKYVFLVTGLVAILGLGVYLYWPSIISWTNPREGITIGSVTYPEEVYRTQRLPIFVEVVNVGDVGKDVLVEVISKDNPIISNKTRLDRSGSVGNVSLSFPVKSVGQQAFTVKVYWIGPSEICKIEQGSKDGTLIVLGSEYDTSSAPSIASIAENFEWTLTIFNTGNAPATLLTVQVIEKGPLSIFPPDLETLDNFGIGETRKVTFRFTVPHDAPEGKCTIRVKLTTSYPSGKETIFRDFTVNLQKSPTQVELENLIFWTTLIAGVAFALTYIFRKKRQAF